MGESKLRWISSSGGPLILLPSELVESWSGIDAPGDGRVVEATARWNPDEPATDYDAACDVRDLIANVEVGEGRGVVLAGEPHPTAVWRSGDDVWLVRWTSGESERAVIDRLRKAAFDLDEGTVALIEARPGPLVLFDAACPGTEVGEDKLEIELHPGSYVASAAPVSVDDETALVVVGLKRAD